MDDNAIVLQFNVQSYAQNFKMLCLGVAASRGQMSGHQLIELVRTVNSDDWKAIPGNWVKIEIPDTVYTMNNAKGWSASQLADITPMRDTKNQPENGPTPWLIKLDLPCQLPSKYSDTDGVNHPNYYVSGKFEVLDIIEEFCSSLEGRAAFDNGNVIKYILRWHRKNGVEDLKKAMWYIQDLIKQVESEENNNENSTDN